MDISQVIFILVALISLIAALFVVTSRNLVHSAFWLILTLFGVAILYVLLNAGFFSVVQVVVYIGAISILFIFAVMLTRRVMKDTGAQNNSYWWLAALIALGFFGGLAAMLLKIPAVNATPSELSVDAEPLRHLGMALVAPDGFLLPFELASVLLVAAMIGAIFVSVEKKR
jgi:NADH-quinone oxidoreductase subunit J